MSGSLWSSDLTSPSIRELFRKILYLDIHMNMLLGYVTWINYLYYLTNPSIRGLFCKIMYLDIIHVPVYIARISYLHTLFLWSHESLNKRALLQDNVPEYIKCIYYLNMLPGCIISIILRVPQKKEGSIAKETFLKGLASWDIFIYETGP